MFSNITKAWTRRPTFSLLYTFTSSKRALVNNYSIHHAVNKERFSLNSSPEEEKPDPNRFKLLTKEQVCSLLSTEEEKGGAGLSIEKVEPLRNVGFDGTSLANIIRNIQKRDEYFAIEQLAATFREARIPLTVELSNTLMAIVHWIVHSLVESEIIGNVKKTSLKELRESEKYDYFKRFE